MGCQGGTNATSGVVPEITRKLYDLVQERKIDEARALQLRLLELFDAMLYSADFPEGFRAAVELRGFDFGRGRQPMSESQEIDRAALQRVLQCILHDFDFVDAPAEGCAPRSGNMAADRVSQITEEVIAQLRRQGVM
jgi:4-hydroxy-tetrahydrodipicolinate synthase